MKTARWMLLLLVGGVTLLALAPGARVMAAGEDSDEDFEEDDAAVDAGEVDDMFADDGMATEEEGDDAPAWQETAKEGEALAKGGSFEDALSKFEHALVQAGDSPPPQLHAQAATMLLRLERFEDALEHAEIAVAGDKFDVNARMGLSHALQRLQKWGEALASFETLVEITNQAPWALKQLGNHQLMGRQFREAKKNFKKAVKVAEDDVELYMLMAECYAGEEFFRSAEKEYRKALALAPEEANVYIRFANLLKTMGPKKYDESLTHAAKAVELATEEQKPSYEQAQRDIEKYIAEHPEGERKSSYKVKEQISFLASVAKWFGKVDWRYLIQGWGTLLALLGASGYGVYSWADSKRIAAEKAIAKAKKAKNPKKRRGNDAAPIDPQAWVSASGQSKR